MFLRGFRYLKREEGSTDTDIMFSEDVRVVLCIISGNFACNKYECFQIVKG